VAPLVVALADFLDTRVVRPWLAAIVPVPPSIEDRPVQPVRELARALAARTGLPLAEGYLVKQRPTPMLNDIDSPADRQRVLERVFTVTDPERYRGQWVLLFDEICQSETTLAAATRVLLEQGGVGRVYTLVVTRTRTRPPYSDVGMREMVDRIELVPEDPRYPLQLREGKKKNKKEKEKDWPPTLFYRGNLELLASDRLVAIVGSRRVGKKAMEATKELARRLAGSGWVIVSGFARGIDQAAFEGALADPSGRTIAVLAQGLDEQLRDEDQRLMEEKLATCGERLLVVSPFPPGEPWSGRNAMKRNEIIVGLAQVVIVGAIGPERTPRKDGRPRRSETWDAVHKAVRWGREVWIPGYLRGNEHAERLCACYPAVRVIDDPVGELEQRWLEAANDEGRGETRPQQAVLFW